jgi:hypothetical protein
VDEREDGGGHQDGRRGAERLLQPGLDDAAVQKLLDRPGQDHRQRDQGQQDGRVALGGLGDGVVGQREPELLEEVRRRGQGPEQHDHAADGPREVPDGRPLEPEERPGALDVGEVEAGHGEHADVLGDREDGRPRRGPLGQGGTDECGGDRDDDQSGEDAGQADAGRRQDGRGVVAVRGGGHLRRVRVGARLIFPVGHRECVRTRESRPSAVRPSAVRLT